jgi:hypothetical protein
VLKLKNLIDEKFAKFHIKASSKQLFLNNTFKIIESKNDTIEFFELIGTKGSSYEIGVPYKSSENWVTFIIKKKT